MKKVIRDKDSTPTEEDIEVVKTRLGDVLYYVAMLADYFDLTLSEVATENMKRSTTFLQSRTPSKE